MKIAGIIAEYNPFHNGHEYQIERTKELTGADYVVVIMSGNFVQRGTPAIMPKEMRAKEALSHGAGLVIELPVEYATGSAEQFAAGAVSILHNLGCVDYLCFGSECGQLEPLQEIARILSDEPEEYSALLQDFLKAGMSYPKARAEAMKTSFPSDDFDKILEEPNNILAIEYLKALKKLKSKILPVTIPRVSSGYHDTELTKEFSSATAIRGYMEEQRFDEIADQLPEGSTDFYFQNFELRFPVYTEDFSLILKYILLHETAESLADYADVSTELANRIYNQRNRFVSIEQFCTLLKTKELTYARISRGLLHILLSVKKATPKKIEYAHVLGFALKDATLLSTIKKHTTIPLLTKLTETDDLSQNAKDMLARDIYATNLYESVITDKFKTDYISAYEQPFIRV